MVIRINIDNNINEDEVIINCKDINSDIKQIQSYITSLNSKNKFSFYKKDVEYFLSINDILFFETTDNSICAHTVDDVFETKYKLYELENILPNNFIRISKSSIININHIYSIEKNITSSSVVKFNKSYKQVYVSRMYFKSLRERMEEKRFYEN